MHAHCTYLCDYSFVPVTALIRSLSLILSASHPINTYLLYRLRCHNRKLHLRTQSSSIGRREWYFVAVMTGKSHQIHQIHWLNEANKNNKKENVEISEKLFERILLARGHVATTTLLHILSFFLYKHLRYYVQLLSFGTHFPLFPLLVCANKLYFIWVFEHTAIFIY